MTYPYRLPNEPKVTIREILPWIVKKKEVFLGDVVGHFRITSNDASVRLLKLHRWGYLSRRKGRFPESGVYHYRATAFGKKAAKKWSKK